MKAKLEKLAKQIATWKDIVAKYPDCAAYKDMLAQLEQKRADLASTIGKNP